MTTKVVCVAPKKVAVAGQQEGATNKTPNQPSATLDADQIRRKWQKEMSALMAAPALQRTTA